MKKNNPKKTLVMGILNLTPDSFSDGGEYNSLKQAIKRAQEMQEQGADIIDIGGESTGPNSKNITLKEEIKRIMPILKKLRKIIKIKISIDTYKANLAKLALEEGADIINDITAMRGDKEMAKIIANYKCPIILMYSKDKTPRTTIKNKNYKNIIKTIKDFLQERIEFAEKQGIQKSKIIIDPGMGHFISAIPNYSLEVINNLEKFKSLKCPILLGI